MVLKNEILLTDFLIEPIDFILKLMVMSIDIRSVCIKLEQK